MPETSAGLLMYRSRNGQLEVLLVHPGGPFWRNRDEGAWSIPKGVPEPEDEDLLHVARREFEEETGVQPEGPFIELGAVTQRGGKTVHAWAFRGDCEPDRIQSDTFELEWPPNSGRTQEFPEIDRADFFRLSQARRKINSAQATLLDVLEERIANSE